MARTLTPNGDLKKQVKEVIRLSVPSILTQITTVVMHYIDSAMVGGLGANASASVGLVSTSTWLLSGLTYAVSAGFSVQVAHCIGGGKEKDARDVIRHGLLVAGVISALLCLLGVSIYKYVPIWLGGDQELWKDASSYFLMWSLMLPFFQLNGLSASFLQCSGNMITPGILNVLMCALDVGFNALFIPMFGVLGAGLGTALACAVVSLIMAYCCCIRNPVLRINRKESFGLRKEILHKAVKIGTPVALQEIAMCGAMVVSTVIIAPLGAVAISANSFAVTAEGVCYMPGNGIGLAATTLVGKSLGAGENKLAKRYGNICIAMGAIVMAMTGGLMFLVCPVVFSTMTPDLQVRELATQVLRIELLAEPLYGVSMVAAGALRGAEDTFIPSILNLGSIWIVRLSLAALLVGSLGLHGVWIAMATELSIRGILFLLRQKTTKYYRLA